MAIYFIEDRYLYKEGVELEGNGAGRCRAQPLRANPRGWRGGGEGGRTRRETEGGRKAGGRGEGGGGQVSHHARLAAEHPAARRAASVASYYLNVIEWQSAMANRKPRGTGLVGIRYPPAHF
jgi:hypothetical protein